MTDQFIGEIRMFSGNFAPANWAFCDGQLLPITGNEALFSLLGTIYGGDGRTTFALPDMRGRVPLHMGSGAGLSPRTLGTKGGQEAVTIGVGQLPSHNHQLVTNSQQATQTDAAGNVLAALSPSTTTSMYLENTPSQAMSVAAIGDAPGSGQSHDNMMPTQCVSFIIALQGIFPSRSW